MRKQDTYLLANEIPIIYEQEGCPGSVDEFGGLLATLIATPGMNCRAERLQTILT